MTKSKITPALYVLCSIVFLSAFLSACCDCDKSTQAKTDTPSIRADTSIPQFRAERSSIYRKLFSPDSEKSRIHDTLLQRGVRFNDEMPCLRDTSGGIVKGFRFDPKDFVEVTGLAQARTLFFQFAVSNTEDSVMIRRDPRKASYTLVIVPLDKDGKRIWDNTAKEFVAFDFTCPCPANTQCCPKQ